MDSVGTGRWVGDLKTCFLLDDGWSFRVQVNRYLLAGRAWPIPKTVAEAMGLQSEHSIALDPAEKDSPQVTVRREGDRCLVDPIDQQLRMLNARENDVAFFCFRESRYRVVLRRVAEIDVSDPLGELLWRCGLDPQDEQHRRDPWHRLARTLGGSRRTRDEARSRLELRRDSGALELLDRITGVGPSASRWPDGWQYICPIDPTTESFALLAAGKRRVAMGVVDVSGQPDDSLIVTDGGIAWLEDEEMDPLVAGASSRALPFGLIPAATRRSWSAWLRGEHLIRLTGLSGATIELFRRDASWESEDGEEGALVELLTKIPPVFDECDPPERRIADTYPRSGLAFDRILTSAEACGLQSIVSDTKSGIRAIYSRGRDSTGSGLLDVLT